MKKQSTWRRNVAVLAGLTVPLWLAPLAWYLAYQPLDFLSEAGLFLLSLDLFLVFLVLIAAGVIFVGPLLILFRSRHRPRLATLALALLFLLSYVSGLFLGWMVWLERVEGIVSRSEPLVDAIRAFEAEYRRPPHSLDEIVPAHLESVPHTGIGTRPDYRYVTGEPERYDGNPWVLIIHPPCHPMGFDLLMYFPKQNYPKVGYGGGLQRIGAWAYVHE